VQDNAGGIGVKEEVKKMLYDEIENPWEFVVKAAGEYKKEFRKTAKIGVPPKIDDMLVKALMKQKGIEPEEKKKEE
jgi:hypothetical protein